ncbi:hemoglobin [Fibrisoma montanum]|uniref:Hemoglobin n=1 Tax=Fibrisoma montanum TaxID=2305895 RepID=A0A418MKH9_9BACT|nr:hemoglobin [Fibrisoma montanum]
MTPDQIRIVKLSWSSYRNVDPALLGEVFYSKLFLEYPSMQSLFKAPIEQQYKKLVEMLNIMVARLDRQAEVLNLIEQLGTRHQQYGVKPEHYFAMGKVLLWTLKSGLGDRWTNEIEMAWMAVYELYATCMMLAK